MEKNLEQLVREIEAGEPLAAKDEAYDRLVLSVTRQYRGKGLSLDELVALAKTAFMKKKCQFTLYYPHIFVSLQTRNQFEYVERTVKHR